MNSGQSHHISDKIHDQCRLDGKSVLIKIKQSPATEETTTCDVMPTKWNKTQPTCWHTSNATEETRTSSHRIPRTSPARECREHEKSSQPWHGVWSWVSSSGTKRIERISNKRWLEDGPVGCFPSCRVRRQSPPRFAIRPSLSDGCRPSLDQLR